MVQLNPAKWGKKKKEEAPKPKRRGRLPLKQRKAAQEEARKRREEAGAKRKKEREGGVDIKKQQFNSKLLNFANFIKEDVMRDLKKISKSKKDMEIKLGDGSEIPIDPMTAEIFVKYIEGLKSSEQKKVINQIQRTERGFMNVLGKAHGE